MYSVKESWENAKALLGIETGIIVFLSSAASFFYSSLLKMGFAQDQLIGFLCNDWKDVRLVHSQIRFAVCNLILDLLWQDMRSRGADHAQETFLVLDEYQHLDSIHDDAPLPNMLREGRRYGLSVILSTQNLSGFTVKEKELVNQAATKIYFRQTKRDAFEITKGFPEKERRTMANTLTSLKVGQCCAEGVFSIDKMLKDSMVTLNIRKQKQIAITVPSVRRAKVSR